MAASNEKLKHMIRDYNPARQDMLCKIDIIKLSQMPELKNPTPDKKDVYETFFDYATALVQNHPNARLDEYIEKVFGQSMEDMAKIARDAAKKYEAVTKKEIPMQQPLMMQREQHSVA